MADSIPLAGVPQLQLTKTGFNPTVWDVVEVRCILTALGRVDNKVPLEIALMILSLASYYPRQSTSRHEEAIYVANQFWSPGPLATVTGIYLTLATLPIASNIARTKSITFQMRAADQGWADNGGHGTYHNSHTWFEASILRPQSESEASTAAVLSNTGMGNFPTPREARDYLRDHGWNMVDRNGVVLWKVHNNITARGEYNNYRADWVAGIPTKVGDPRAMGDGQGFLELLRPDDIVVLWARAEQQAWVNKVHEATIEIEYEVL